MAIRSDRSGTSLAAPSAIGVVIADDNFLVREGTRRLLGESGKVEVLATVADATELVAATERLRPHAVLTDIRMPPTHRREGIEAAHQIRQRFPQIGVVALSQYAEATYAIELFSQGTGGLGYLLKDRLGQLDDLTDALCDVAQGGSAIDPEIVDLLIARRQNRSSSLLEHLTARERDVLREMARGRSNPGIMSALSLSESTVEKHVSSIFSKLLLANEPSTNRRVAAVLAFLKEPDER